MNVNTGTPNGEIFISLKYQGLLQQHADKMESFNTSNIGNKILVWIIKINITIFKRNNMHHMLILKCHGKTIFYQQYMLFMVWKIREKSTLISYFHYCMYPNLGEYRCVLSCIPFSCVECTEQLDKSCINGEIFRTTAICICNRMSVPLNFMSL